MINSSTTSSSKNFSADCIGLVLAGGQSSRMGSDKSHLMRNQENMLNFSKQVLQEIGLKNIVISGNQHENGIKDVINNAGPMGGIYSVLKAYQPKALLILPVDLPLMTSEILMKLKQTGELKNQACCYHDAYLPLYLPNNAFTEIFFNQAFNHFSGKGPSIRALLKNIPHQILSVDSPKALFNTNTPDEWQKAKSIFSTQRNSHVSK